MLVELLKEAGLQICDVGGMKKSNTLIVYSDESADDTLFSTSNLETLSTGSNYKKITHVITKLKDANNQNINGCNYESIRSTSIFTENTLTPNKLHSFICGEITLQYPDNNEIEKYTLVMNEDISQPFTLNQEIDMGTFVLTPTQIPVKKLPRYSRVNIKLTFKPNSNNRSMQYVKMTFT